MFTRPAVFTSPGNQWYCLRHGQSTANVSQTIASDPATATQKFGLTDTGRQQVENTMASQSALTSDTRIITSDFLRARQTAQLAAEFLSCAEPSTNELLRERWFGEWDNASATHYEDVWAFDKNDPNHTEFGVESVTAVARRIGTLIEQIEDKFSDQVFLVVSHGDPLQILECVFRNQNIAHHRDLPSLNTAELRQLFGS